MSALLLDGPGSWRRASTGKIRLVISLFGALLLEVHSASAAVGNGSPAWQLAFTAPAACSSESDFRRALDDRVRRKPSIRPREHRIVVVIEPANGGWRGRLVVESRADGVRVQRSAEAQGCDELIAALALMVELALDLEPPALPEATSATPASESALSQTPAPPRPPPAPRPAVTPSHPRRESAKDLTRRTEGEIGFLLPWRSVVGWRDRVAVAPGILWGSRADRGFAPWARISGERVASRVSDSAGLGASLTWTVAELDACSHKWALSESAFVSPCARVSIGSLRARGANGVDAPRDLTRLWLTAGAGAEAAIPLVGPLWLRMQGGVEAILLRQRVYVDSDPDRVLVQIPAVLGRLGVGLGVRIW